MDLRAYTTSAGSVLKIPNQVLDVDMSTGFGILSTNLRQLVLVRGLKDPSAGAKRTCRSDRMTSYSLIPTTNL